VESAGLQETGAFPLWPLHRRRPGESFSIVTNIRPLRTRARLEQSHSPSAGYVSRKAKVLLRILRDILYDIFLAG
jgi:hypothetical protein